MIRFKDISIRGKLTLLLGVFIGGMMIFGVVAYTALQTVKVGSPLYGRIEVEMTLHNNFALPVASLDPAALMIYRIMMSRTAADTQEYLAKFAELEKTYDERREYWMANLPEGPMKELLRKTYSRGRWLFQN